VLLSDFIRLSAQDNPTWGGNVPTNYANLVCRFGKVLKKLQTEHANMTSAFASALEVPSRNKSKKKLHTEEPLTKCRLVSHILLVLSKSSFLLSFWLLFLAFFPALTTVINPILLMSAFLHFLFSELHCFTPLVPPQRFRSVKVLSAISFHPFFHE
jgi:hypothetical protein